MSLGRATKDSRYRKRILAHVAPYKAHPVHHNVEMQAHHAISAEGVNRATGVGALLVKFGYDINCLENLVLIPSTLQGACHLSVQLHFGDHNAPISGPKNADDAEHPTDYHDMVSDRLKKIKRMLDGKCPKDHPKMFDKLKKKMDKISKDIVDDIQKNSMQARLTTIDFHFLKGSQVGCGGVDLISKHRSNPCGVGRDHEGQQKKGQAAENISCKKMNYILKPGR